LVNATASSLGSLLLDSHESFLGEKDFQVSSHCFDVHANPVSECALADPSDAVLCEPEERQPQHSCRWGKAGQSLVDKPVELLNLPDAPPWLRCDGLTGCYVVLLAVVLRARIVTGNGPSAFALVVSILAGHTGMRSQSRIM
jgi:hypothetical protein